MRPFTLLPAALVTGCLIQNPGFDAGQTTAATEAATTDGTTTDGDITGLTAATDPDTTDAVDTTLGGTFGGSGSSSTTSAATTGCALEPLFPDADDDGFGAGAAVPACPGDPGFSGVDGDCDDANNTINPDATELCNDLDDDCDGLKDEFSSANQTSCSDCKLAEFAGHSYWFCTSLLKWDDAREVCHAFGAVELPIVDDKPENDFIFAGNAVPDSPLWVGGRDLDPNMNAHYTWYDGSPLSFNNFALVDLDNGCISMPNGDGGQWRDRDCASKYAFACESTS